MKKIVCFLLSVAMLCSMTTISIFADSETTAPVEEDEVAIALELIELDDEQIATASYVPFSSGVYRFDSMFNTQMCMMVEDGEYTSGAHVVQWLSDGNSRDNLFKVEYAGYGNIPATSQNADYYVIRSMVNSEIGLTAATPASGANTVTLESLDTDNDNQYWTQYWVHMEDSGCDMWMNAATGTYLSTPFDGSLGEDLEMSSGAIAWWQLVEYTGSTIQGVEFHAGSTSLYGGSYSFYTAYMYSSEIGVNGPVQYDVQGIDGNVTDKAEMYGNELYAKKAGTVEVVVSASGVSATATRTVTIIGYSTAEFAAEGFGFDMYAASSYCRYKFSAMIYSYTSSGITTYYYGDVAVSTEDLHIVNTDLYCPLGTVPVGVVYTELIHYVIQTDDVSLIHDDLGEDLEVFAIDANQTLRQYGRTPEAIRTIYVDPLTQDEKETLVSQYYAMWIAHKTECPYCYGETWPNPHINP